MKGISYNNISTSRDSDTNILITYAINGPDNILLNALSETVIYCQLDHKEQVLIKLSRFLFPELHFKIEFAQWHPFCLCLHVLKILQRL